MLRLIRFPNLVIVALTQYLLQYRILMPAITRCDLKPMLPHLQFALLVLSTVLIAAGGYIVNDIEDVEIDKRNKPEHKRIVGRVYSVAFSWRLYWLLTIFGVLVSLYLALYIHDFVQLLIYPIAVFLLWAYARWFKKMFLIGNLVVAFFCAFVAWIVYYAEQMNTYSDMQTGFTIDKQFYWIEFFVLYAYFAFISTLFREIVKDIEDAEGDRAGNCRTLPIVLGEVWAKRVALGVGLFFWFSLSVVNFIVFSNVFFKSTLIHVLIGLPLAYTLFLLYFAKTKLDFARVSLFAKLIMLSGLIIILIEQF